MTFVDLLSKAGAVLFGNDHLHLEIAAEGRRGHQGWDDSEGHKLETSRVGRSERLCLWRWFLHRCRLGCFVKKSSCSVGMKGFASNLKHCIPGSEVLTSLSARSARCLERPRS